MNIGLFIDTWYPMVDGVIKVVDNYAMRLAKFANVTVFCPEGDDGGRSYPYKVVRCKSLPMLGYDYTFPTSMLDVQFDKQLIESKLDIVHIHSPFQVAIAGLLYARVHNLPAVATLHSQYKQDFEKQFHTSVAVDVAVNGIMKVFGSCTQCWAVNSSIRDLYVQEYGLKAPCKVRLNATDHKPVANPEQAARRVNDSFGIPADATVFLFTGRINFIKNIDFIVRSLAIAKAQGLNNFRMLFVGRGQDEEALAALVKEKGLEKEVVMCGLVSDRSLLECLYSRAKLFLFPSLYDANSLVQIEAACQGTPGVFLEGARTASTVKDGVNGYICPNSEEAYAARILDILAHPEEYQKTSKAAREQLYLDWDTVVKDVYQDYERLLGL